MAALPPVSTGFFAGNTLASSMNDRAAAAINSNNNYPGWGISNNNNANDNNDNSKIDKSDNSDRNNNNHNLGGIELPLWSPSLILNSPTWLAAITSAGAADGHEQNTAFNGTHFFNNWQASSAQAQEPAQYRAKQCILAFNPTRPEPCCASPTMALPGGDVPIKPNTLPRGSGASLSSSMDGVGHQWQPASKATGADAYPSAKRAHHEDSCRTPSPASIGCALSPLLEAADTADAAGASPSQPLEQLCALLQETPAEREIESQVTSNQANLILSSPSPGDEAEHSASCVLSALHEVVLPSADVVQDSALGYESGTDASVHLVAPSIPTAVDTDILASNPVQSSTLVDFGVDLELLEEETTREALSAAFEATPSTQASKPALTSTTAASSSKRAPRRRRRRRHRVRRRMAELPPSQQQRQRDQARIAAQRRRAKQLASDARVESAIERALARRQLLEQLQADLASQLEVLRGVVRQRYGTRT
ncbi:uncharacterized protein MONBRDRAFT_23290 [Monosiga brevicollis MX1]|uniref:BZIP domain-containing protein n=1 Tax=Monosiga brevicollis TaxID=81824 RepID=A9USY9_MONBE|nr:uncharacterized protein MONBRDRAFT_23290 [Monosiga brevicollis MX1]EDQ91151.1 predicted protein [Monosiga brevicollis MX1]|eukprot:XP_001743573.1 hypothetical protein [Monosiga brevicollis MX1]